jgi:hypothetical protein
MGRQLGTWIGIAWLVLTGAARGAETAPDFATEVLPVLTRAGCNSGACHGAAIGRGGFRLSLLGSDPQADYASIVEEYKGRRVHLVRPEASLLLRKPAGKLSHGGGRRLPVDGEGHARVLGWLQAGAPPSSGRLLQSLELTPSNQWLPRPDEHFTVRATAHFNDGSMADVTRWAIFTPTDPAALDCTGNGDVTALRRGQHELLVRFLGAIGCVTVVIPYHDTPPSAERPGTNFVDDHINRVLDRLRLPHAPRSNDAMLARRVFLDVLGQLPEPEEVEAFAADPAADKWTRLIDRLMDRPEFVDYWSYQWGDLLRIESGRLRPEGAAAFHGWVREQVRRNTPLDQFARELLLAGGDSYRNGPANFSRVSADARAEAEFVGHVFLGVRIQCANCHNHPLDHWTQDDYHGLAATFARVGRGREVALLPRGEVTHPRTGRPATPRIPGVRDLADDGDPREALAAWLTDRANPYFARAAVNRLWRALMGRGLVESPDDHRATNPATHPELLDELARDFVAHGYDVRHTLRTILASEAYRRSATAVDGNRMDDRFYSRALVRALPPPVLVDAVARVTGVPEKLGDLPPGTRAVALGDARVPSQPLDLLGRCSRDTDCSTPPAAGGSLPLVLHAINGPWLNAKVTSPTGRIARLLREGRMERDVVTDVYRVALGREPTDKELAHWLPQLTAASADERRQSCEDFLWAMLNSSEFGTNH